jgi:hypothetical protein
MQNYNIKFIDEAYVCHQNMTYAVESVDDINEIQSKLSTTHTLGTPK